MIKYVKLGDACLVRRGTTITRKQTKKGNVPVIAGGRKATYFHNKHNRESGTITISGSGASAGLVNYWSIPIFASDCSTVELKDNKQNTKFVYYYMQSMQEFIYKDMRSGAAQPHVYAKDIANLNFPLLSLEEQQRIVAKLDAIFTEINKLIEASEINIKNINKYIGRVTDYLIHNDIKNYKNFTLNDITNNITCGVAKRPEYVDKGIIFLSARNVKHGKMKWVNYKFISEEAHKILTKNSKPEVGDILYSRVGAGFGDAAIIDRDVELSIFVSLTLIKVKPIVLNEYIFYYLNSPIIKELARKNITGTGVGNLNVGAVKRFKIKLPDLKNQKLIIDKLKSLNILGENIINNYIKKKNNYIALKQSIYDSLLFNKKTKVA